MTTEIVELRVGNLDCENEAAAIERGFKDFPGLLKLTVYPKAAKVAATIDAETTDVARVKEKLTALGFPPAASAMELPAQPRPWRNPKVVTSAASGILLLVGWLASLAGAPSGVSFGIYLAAIVIGGYYFGREAIEELIFEREVGIELLMATAAIVATAMGLAGEGATLVFLYSISEAAEGYTEDKTRSAVKALMSLVPKVALVRRDGGEREVPVEDLAVDEVFVVRPGEAVATDGIVLSGSSFIDEAPVTGESVPVEKSAGAKVFAGSVNGESALEVRATTTFADNTISRIIHMVEEAQERKGKSQRFIERFGKRYSPAVLAIGGLIAVLPPLLTDVSWPTALTRATVFIVAAAPCALVISIPITLVASLGTGARKGVLIKGGVYVEELAKVKVVAFDKTGTLTMGRPEVTDVLTADGGARVEAELIALAAGIERHSQHPLARAITRCAEVREIVPASLTAARALPGAGASAMSHGKAHYAGNPALFDSTLKLSLDGWQGDIERMQTDGKTVVLVGDETRVAGLLAISDTLRPNAAKALADLHALGVRSVMLTGDNSRAAKAIAHKLGIDEVYAELKPEGKASKVAELAQLHGHVAMVGDGVNDAPALAEATVGIAMGAAGTDVALETADVALMADDLEKLAYALGLAKRNRHIVRQNIGLSALVVGTLIVGALGGLLSLPMAVVAHEVSEWIVIGNGLRMLRS